MKREHFIESKVETFPSLLCYKCGAVIKQIQDGVSFWNPNITTKEKNICRNCYDVFMYTKTKGYDKWKDNYSKMEREKKISRKKYKSKLRYFKRRSI